MKTGTEFLIANSPTGRDVLRALLEDVRDGWTAPEKALKQIEEMMRTIAQTAMDCAALTSRASTQHGEVRPEVPVTCEKHYWHSIVGAPCPSCTAVNQP